MWIDAGQATNAVNGLLKSLYKPAGDRTEHYELQDIDRPKQSGYDFALRKYYYKSETSSHHVRV
jgi:hypothetical protein